MSRVLVSLSRTRSLFTVESSRVPIENSVSFHGREFSCPYRELGLSSRSRVLVSLSRTRSLFTVESSRVPIENSVSFHGREFLVSLVGERGRVEGGREPVCFTRESEGGSRAGGSPSRSCRVGDLSGVEGGREGKRKGGWQDACVSEDARAGEADRRSLTNSRKGREKQHVGETPSPAVVLETRGATMEEAFHAVKRFSAAFHAFQALKRPLPSEGRAPPKESPTEGRLCILVCLRLAVKPLPSKGRASPKAGRCQRCPNQQHKPPAPSPK